MSHVTVYPCASYEGVPAEVERAFAAYAPPMDGKRVVLKVNLLGPCRPEEHVTTHPSLVSAAVAACRRRGAAEIVVGDNPGMSSYGSTDHVARMTGTIEAAAGCYRNIAEAPRMVEVPTPGVGRVPVSRAVLEADVVIGLAKMKTHVATGITGAVKNTFGYVVGAAKTQLHAACPGKEAFARAVLDVYALRPPDFSIVDAVYAMEGQGPSGGQPRFVGRLLASADNVALDAVMARMMGFRPEQIPYLVAAAERGLGEIGDDRIHVEGPTDPIPGFRRPKYGQSMGTWGARLVSRIYVTQPQADTDICIKCGACARQCPVEAIRMDPYPVIDAARCISCFCCHEFCKPKAMRLAPRIRIMKFLRGRK
ncbi:MAG: DUF362 domain-containing protein [Phycisphaerae bacterium]|nr:DUF362 domain-containing protein [Phycisphaerae bacterium]